MKTHTSICLTVATKNKVDTLIESYGVKITHDNFVLAGLAALKKLSIDDKNILFTLIQSESNNTENNMQEVA